VSKTTSFIAELIKTANSEEVIPDYEGKRLLDNATSVIQHLRGLLGYRFSATTETLHHLRSMSKAASVGWTSDTQMRFGLLNAATMIRDLNIELDKRVAGIVHAENSTRS
jgi:hypothetical protein